MIEAGIDEFSNWYLLNRERLLNHLYSWKDQGLATKEQFLSEWPLERLMDMPLDDYVIGFGENNESLCYELEFGKYQMLYMSILGGTSGKYGLYYSKESHDFRDSNNKHIPSSEVIRSFVSLKYQLMEILDAGLKYDFSQKCLNNQYTDDFESKNIFSTKPALITKLLCIYSKGGLYSGYNMRHEQQLIWDKFVPLRGNGYYKQNYLITKMISNRFPELNGDALSSVLVDYKDHVLSSDDIELVI